MLQSPLERFFPASERLDLFVGGHEFLAEVHDDGPGGAHVRVNAVVGLSNAGVP